MPAPQITMVCSMRREGGWSTPHVQRESPTRPLLSIHFEALYGQEKKAMVVQKRTQWRSEATPAQALAVADLRAVPVAEAVAVAGAGAVPQAWIHSNATSARSPLPLKGQTAGWAKWHVPTRNATTWRITMGMSMAAIVARSVAPHPKARPRSSCMADFVCENSTNRTILGCQCLCPSGAASNNHCTVVFFFCQREDQSRSGRTPSEFLFRSNQPRLG